MGWHEDNKWNMKNWGMIAQVYIPPRMGALKLTKSNGRGSALNVALVMRLGFLIVHVAKEINNECSINF